MRTPEISRSLWSKRRMRGERGKKRVARWHEARVKRGGESQSNISQEIGHGKTIKNINVSPPPPKIY